MAATDYSQYQTWEPVTAGTGATYYKVPGTGYLYDPFLSQSKGRPVLWPNTEKAYNDQKRAQKQQEFNQSPAGQVIPVVAGTAGTLGGAWAINRFANPSAPSATAPVTPAPVAPGEVIAAQTNAVATPASNFVQSAGGGAGSAGGGGAPTPELVGASRLTPVGTASNGGTIMSDGSVTPPAATGTNWGAIGQGAGGVLQGYQAYQNWKDGDKAGAFLQGAAGAANLGSAMGVTQFAPYAAPLTAAAGLYGTYKGIQSGNAKASAMSGAEAGAGIGTMILPGVGTAVGAAIGALTGAGLGHIKTAKSGAQQTRDSIRSGFQNAGIADAKYGVKLADGSTFNIGLDGHAKYKNVGTNIDGSTERNAYDVDWSNPLASKAATQIDQRVRAMFGPDASQKQVSDAVGMLTNAAANNAKSEEEVNKNIDSIFSSKNMAQPKGAPIDPNSEIGKKLAQRMNQR